MYTPSYWETSAFWQTEWDVIVIGSGLVGLLTAQELKLKYPKANILVLERGILPMGASTRNAGVACFGSLSELLSQQQKEGTKAMLDLVQFRFQGLKRLLNGINWQDIDYTLTGGYEVFTPSEEETYQQYLQERHVINTLLAPITGLTETYLCKDEDIHKMGFNGVSHLIYNPAEGILHSGKLIRTLWQNAQLIGINVWNNVEVQHLHPHTSHVQVQLSQGVLQSKKVVVATNAFAKQLLPQLDIVPGRGQVVITKPIHNLKLQGAFHVEEGYYYFRNVDNNRVLLGGGRNLDFKTEETTQFGLTELVQQKLHQLLQETILPYTSFEIDQQWSGIMGFGQEKSPILGEMLPNVYAAVRMSGMGVAIGSMVAHTLAQQIEL